MRNIANAQQNMNEKDALLQQLNDIQMPDPVGFWPLAPGWWIVLFLLLAFVAFAIYTLVKWIQRTRYRKQALAILKQLDLRKNTVSREHTLQQVLSLLKRTVLTAYKHSRNPVASLYGRDFFILLEATLDNEFPRLDAKWHNAIYKKALPDNDDYAIEELLQFAKIWISKHQILDKMSLQQRLQKSGIHTSLVDKGLEARSV